MTQKSPLWTKDYILAFLSNFLIFIPFYILVPILPFYLIEELHISETQTGIILSLYTISALAIRPFSGFMVDHFRRKPFYVVCYTAFAAVFFCYALSEVVAFFVVLRILHGLVFGLITVSANTIAIDIMPSERRAEGIGFFGMSTNLAMAIGPMVGFALYGSMSFAPIFYISFATCVLGLVCAVSIRPSAKHAPKPIAPHESVLSLDRFLLIPAVRGAVAFLLTAIGYGVITNYIGLYAKSTGAESAAGLFFLIQAGGIVAARFLSSGMLNRGLMARAMYYGMGLLLLGYGLLTTSPTLYSMLGAAATLGLGYGFITPTIQAMFINMAPHSRRGTANSTYFTAWDLGIGIGIALGGRIIEHSSFATLFALCLICVVCGLVFFRYCVAAHYLRSKLE